MVTLLKTGVAAVALCIALVAAKFRFEHLLSPADSGIEGALRMQHIDILLFGSSHTRQGYDARMLETATAKQVFVLAYDGLDPVAMLPLMKAMLSDPARRPGYIVIEANCVRLAHEPDIEDPRLFFESPPDVKRELLADYLKTHRGMQAYLDMFSLVANRGNDLILTWSLVHGTIDALSYHGGYVHKNMSGLSPEAFEALTVPLSEDQPNPQQLAALRELISLAKAEHSVVVLVDTPMPAPVAAEQSIQVLQRDLQELAAAEKIPYLKGAPGFPTAEPALFHDSAHLSSAGRELYTRLFAKELMSR
jgi:hypothetical protein